MAIAQNCMTDLETFGTKPGCKIMTIGAVMFNAKNGVQEKEAFYCKVARSPQGFKFELTEDPDTVKWWDGQPAAAKSHIFGKGKRFPLDEALNMFSLWFLKHGGHECRLWGNGANFDEPILVTAYESYATQVPWKFYNSRCYRTLKGLLPHIPMQRVGVHHNALADAVSQAHHAVHLLNNLHAPVPW